MSLFVSLTIVYLSLDAFVNWAIRQSHVYLQWDSSLCTKYRILYPTGEEIHPIYISSSWFLLPSSYAVFVPSGQSRQLSFYLRIFDFWMNPRYWILAHNLSADQHFLVFHDTTRGRMFRVCCHLRDTYLKPPITNNGNLLFRYRGANTKRIRGEISDLRHMMSSSHGLNGVHRLHISRRTRRRNAQNNDSGFLLPS